MLFCVEILLKKWLLSLGIRTIVCSHEISPLPRLVPRGQTTLVEATVSPILFNYLQQISNALGTSTHLRIMGSSGGLLPPKTLLAKDTIFSGPAGGMVGAVAAANCWLLVAGCWLLVVRGVCCLLFVVVVVDQAFKPSRRLSQHRGNPS